MATFSATVREFWNARMGAGTLLSQTPDLSTVCRADLAADRRVMILRTADTTRAVLTPEVAARVGEDRDAFTRFVSAAPEQDLDDASVELDHWAVLGVFDRERLVCVASMYPWDGSLLADVGVLTLPEYRGRGLARAVIRAPYDWARDHDHELQNRCQVDNVACKALATSAGLTCFGEWQVISPDSPT